MVLELDSLEQKNKVNQIIMNIIEQSVKESNAYSLFVYAVRSQVTKDYYLRRLRIFFNYIDLQSDKTMEERCNYFARNGANDPLGI
jgi:hypothetical protein